MVGAEASAAGARAPILQRHATRAATAVTLAAGTGFWAYQLHYERSAVVAFAVLAGIATVGYLSAVGLRPAAEPDRQAPSRSRVGLVAAAAVAVVLLCAAVALSTAPSAFVFSPQRTTQYRPEAVAALLLIGVGLILGAPAWRARIRAAPHAARRALLAALVVGAVVAQLVLARAVLQYTTYDSVQIFSAAYEHAVAPAPELFDADAQRRYFSMLPNNAFLAVVLAGFFTVLHGLGLVGAHQYAWAAVVLNCVVLDIAALLTWAIARRIRVGISATVTGVLTIVFIVASPWLTTPYSDTLGLVFPIGVVALHLRWSPSSARGRIGLWLATGALLAVGYSVKPTVVFVAAAILLVALVGRPGRRGEALRSTAVSTVALGVGFLVVHQLVIAAIDASGVLSFSISRNAGALPFTHFLAMGAQGAGGYNQADVDAALATPHDARATASLSIFLDRVRAFGPIGYPVFLGEKTLYTFSDGTFFQGREGVGPYDRSYFSVDPTSVKLQEIWGQAGVEHWIASSVWQAAWFLILILSLVPLRRTMDAAGRRHVAVLRLSFALMVLFLLFSESRSRYLYLYLPFLLLLAGLGSQALTDAVGRAMQRLRRIVSGSTADGRATT